MDTSHLKAYAPKARREFIAAVTARAAAYGLTAKHIEPVSEQGDVALIGNKAHPRSVAAKRRKLEERIQQRGFAQVMEAMAYTWFNRFMAIRFMELHGYLEHGRRVLSHPEKAAAFEILEACTEVALPGVDREQVIELKLDGRKDEELYRLLLLGQCHALHEAMPFLFEPVDDETELLLPDNLTKTDSLIRHLVDDIPEEDWQQVEIIGWLYQFYISEKKDQVIGKVVKSEDIPAATQLFTPNWIVKYMVQNSLGAQWLATYPGSPLKGQMEYYIEPAEQTDDVKAQLAAITPSQLNPEELTFIDPASGSGHILVEAYELFKAIYLERGYRQRDVAQLILEKNLFGLDIDERAAQLTGFALMMKGRADDRRLFERGVKLNVMVLQDSAGFDAESLAKGVKLGNYGLKPENLSVLKRLFEHATTFGSLIQVPEELATSLTAMNQLIEASSQDLFVSESLKRLRQLVQQAELLAAQYGAVVANPPYMGSKGMNPALKQYVAKSYPDAKHDLMTCFMQRGRLLAASSGLVAMINLPSWLFLSSFESFRQALLREASIRSCLHLGRGIFGADFGSVAFVLGNSRLSNWVGTYRRLFDKQSSVASLEQIRARFLDPGDQRFLAKQETFLEVPGAPIAYWLSTRFHEAFSKNDSLEKHAALRIGMATGKNEQYVRFWFEVAHSRIGFHFTSREEAKSSKRKWFPYAKGGSFRRWYGNVDCVVDWSNDGHALQTTKHPSGARIWAHNFNLEQIFRPAICWTVVTIAETGFRLCPKGHLFDAAAGLCQPNRAADELFILGALNSYVTASALRVINPTVNLHPGYLGRVPHSHQNRPAVTQLVAKCVEISKADWNGFETAWDFQSLPFLAAERHRTLESSYTAWITRNRDTIAEMKRLEEENNGFFIDAYGLADELTPDVPIEQITLTINPAYRYGGKLTEEERWTRFRQDSMKEVVSYGIGCMMGRYSLDAPGVIYAHSGNEGFDPSRYATFPADDDGIVPVTEIEWFDDDAADRLVDFMSVAWDKSDLEDNLSFLSDSLSPKRNESSRETIRRYLCDKFFGDHLQAYRNRPIYWLFSSGKQKAFQCLVYLHRYNEGTLSRMRTKYVIPLQGLIAGRVDRLAEDVAAASSTAHRKRLEKERDTLIKQRTELLQFDEKLRHYADQRITLDLDDGVKVNYAKFGDLLADVKTVTGTKTD